MKYMYEINVDYNSSVYGTRKNIMKKCLLKIKDINECELKIDDCSWNKVCQNTIGSFKCVCLAGFKMIRNECLGFLNFITAAYFGSL